MWRLIFRIQIIRVAAGRVIVQSTMHAKKESPQLCMQKGVTYEYIQSTRASAAEWELDALASFDMMNEAC